MDKKNRSKNVEKGPKSAGVTLKTILTPRIAGFTLKIILLVSKPTGHEVPRCRNNLQLCLIEGMLGSKNYFAIVDGSAQKPRDTPFSGPNRPFWGPSAAILIESNNLFSESCSGAPIT